MNVPVRSCRSHSTKLTSQQCNMRNRVVPITSVALLLLASCGRIPTANDDKPSRSLYTSLDGPSSLSVKPKPVGDSPDPIHRKMLVLRLLLNTRDKCSGSGLSSQSCAELVDDILSTLTNIRDLLMRNAASSGRGSIVGIINSALSHDSEISKVKTNVIETAENVLSRLVESR